MEFVDYRRVHWDPSIVVDKSRGEKLVVYMNVTFPRVPCYRKWSVSSVHIDWEGKGTEVLKAKMLLVNGIDGTRERRSIGGGVFRNRHWERPVVNL